jgi:hypothetical protein
MNITSHRRREVVCMLRSAALTTVSPGDPGGCSAWNAEFGV